ncbi:phage tail assembly protein [Muricoccus aerilatus]|uniref:phage tail assembly protein n=1 Tax=Muricoccus aerilatus TaxID=452982 RepID=UPI0005C18168|nr:phage tail assembly protein [Roseomonas aerilata]
MSQPEVAKTVTIIFDEPLSFNGATHAEVKLREPTVAEFSDASTRQGYGSTQHLLMLIGKLPAGIAAKVPMSKIVEADGFFAQFLRPALPSDVVTEPPHEGDAAIFASLDEKLREPTLAEWEAARDAGAGYLNTAKLASLVTGLPIEVMRRMPVSRAAAVDAYFAVFVTPAPATGQS